MSMAQARGNIKVVLENAGTVTLGSTNHIATGGEGSVYHVSDKSVKIYHKPQEMEARGVVDKVKRLMTLRHPYVVAPAGTVTSPAGDFLGFYMPYVEGPPSGFPLSIVFTNDFYVQHGFDAAKASTLVDRMRETVAFAHGHGARLIDPNELNWFAVNTGVSPEPRSIDVDSWVIGPLPKTVAVMPSIRDWHNRTPDGKNLFDEKSDWFGWGVVTFQVYTGIHPYKGTLDGYSVRDLEKRMQDKASVFTSGVRLNRAVRDFSCIPGPLLNWYEATFQKGERSAPPSPFDTGVTTPRAARVMRAITTLKTGMLVFEKLLGFPGDPVIRTFSCGAVLLSSGNLVDIATKRIVHWVSTRNCEVIKANDGWIIGEVSGRTSVFDYVPFGANSQPQRLAFTTSTKRLMGHENRMFAVTEHGLTEIKLTVLGSRVLASAGQTWGVMVDSTSWFDGIGVQDAMGAKFVVLPQGEAGVATLRVKELDGLKIVAAKAGNQFASIIGADRSGNYQKIELSIDGAYRTYVSDIAQVDGPELNIAILPKRVCATIREDGELTIFVPANGSVTKVEDKQISTDMILSNWENRVIYVQNGEVWSVRMK